MIKNSIKIQELKQINNKARNDLLFQHPSKGEYHQPGRA